MQLVRVMLVMWVWSAGVAHADEYPVSDVDRPLLLNPGMTAFDISADVSAYVASADPNTGQATRFSHDTTSDLSISHQFGRFQVIIGAADRDLSGTVLMRTTEGGAVFIGGDTFTDTTVVTSEYAQRAGYLYKLVAVPHRLAVYASIGLQLNMFDLVNSATPPTSARDLEAFGSVSAELQLTHRFAINLSPRFSVPLAYTSVLAEVSSATIETNAVFAFRRVDLYASVGLSDLQRIPLLIGSVGAEFRWGMH